MFEKFHKIFSHFSKWEWMDWHDLIGMREAKLPYAKKLVYHDGMIICSKMLPDNVKKNYSIELYNFTLNKM